LEKLTDLRARLNVYGDAVPVGAEAILDRAVDAALKDVLASAELYAGGAERRGGRIG
jgi:hypothetical protein